MVSRSSKVLPAPVPLRRRAKGAPKARRSGRRSRRRRAAAGLPSKTGAGQRACGGCASHNMLPHGCLMECKRKSEPDNKRCNAWGQAPQGNGGTSQAEEASGAARSRPSNASRAWLQTQREEAPCDNIPLPNLMPTSATALRLTSARRQAEEAEDHRSAEHQAGADLRQLRLRRLAQ